MCIIRLPYNRLTSFIFKFTQSIDSGIVICFIYYNITSWNICIQISENMESLSNLKPIYCITEYNYTYVVIETKHYFVTMIII